MSLCCFGVCVEREWVFVCESVGWSMGVGVLVNVCLFCGVCVGVFVCVVLSADVGLLRM